MGLSRWKYKLLLEGIDAIQCLMDDIAMPIISNKFILLEYQRMKNRDISRK